MTAPYRHSPTTRRSRPDVCGRTRGKPLSMVFQSTFRGDHARVCMHGERLEVMDGLIQYALLQASVAISILSLVSLLSVVSVELTVNLGTNVALTFYRLSCIGKRACMAKC